MSGMQIKLVTEGREVTISRGNFFGSNDRNRADFKICVKGAILGSGDIIMTNEEVGTLFSIWRGVTR